MRIIFERDARGDRLLQANGRSDTTYEQRMEMELYYVDHASAGLDLKILWDTVWAVLKRKGAK